jgi:hypothetical protein
MTFGTEFNEPCPVVSFRDRANNTLRMANLAHYDVFEWVNRSAAR